VVPDPAGRIPRGLAVENRIADRQVNRPATVDSASSRFREYSFTSEPFLNASIRFHRTRSKIHSGPAKRSA
jgi:hypothetical protein